MSEDNNRAVLFAKLARVMGKIETIPTDGHNKFFDFKYATSQAVTSALRKLLAEENIAFFAETVNIEDTGIKYLVEYRYTFACGESGATYSCQWFGEAGNINSKGNVDDKALAKAGTIALKYFLLKTFIASTGDDPDSEGEENTTQARPKTRSNSTPPTSPGDEIPEGTRRNVVIETGVVKLSEHGSPYVGFKAQSGELVTVWISDSKPDIFLTQKYRDIGDWHEIGLITLPTPITVELVKGKTGYWDLNPKSVPEFNPDWATLGAAAPAQLPGMPAEKVDVDF